jgi:hypothetical protein
VRFVEREGIAKGLRYREHANGGALDIRYLFDADWSKRARDGAVEVGGRRVAVRDYVRDTVLAEFGAGGGESGGGAVRLSGKSHGQNGYQHLHDVAVLSAINPSSAFFEFMRTRGVDPEEVKDALYRQAAYQAVMRCSLRNPEDRRRKRVAVVDRATAEWLSRLFPGSRVSPLGEAVEALGGRKIGRPRMYADDAARKAASRAQKALRLLLQLDGVAASPAAALAGSAFADRFATEAAGLIEHAGDPDAFIDGLRRCHAAVLTSKEDNFLFGPAVFDALRTGEGGTKRGNAKSSRFGASGWTTTAATSRTRRSPRCSRRCAWPASTLTAAGPAPCATACSSRPPAPCRSRRTGRWCARSWRRCAATATARRRRWSGTRACGCTASTARSSPRRRCSTRRVRPPRAPRRRSSPTTRGRAGRRSTCGCGCPGRSCTRTRGRSHPRR